MEVDIEDRKLEVTDNLEYLHYQQNEQIRNIRESLD